jgi:hypothetical protein
MLDPPVFLTASDTASLFRAFSCCAADACELWVTTEIVSTAVSGSTLVVASPATVTLVVRFDFLEQLVNEKAANPSNINKPAFSAIVDAGCI